MYFFLFFSFYLCTVCTIFIIIIIKWPWKRRERECCSIFLQCFDTRELHGMEMSGTLQLLLESRKDGTKFCGTPTGMWKKYRMKIHCTVILILLCSKWQRRIRQQLFWISFPWQWKFNSSVSVFSNYRWYVFVKCDLMGRISYGDGWGLGWTFVGMGGGGHKQSLSPF